MEWKIGRSAKMDVLKKVSLELDQEMRKKVELIYSAAAKSMEFA